MTTFAPASTRERATPKPMPLLAPVTIATRSFSDCTAVLQSTLSTRLQFGHVDVAVGRFVAGCSTGRGAAAHARWCRVLRPARLPRHHHPRHRVQRRYEPGRVVRALPVQG